MEDILSKLKPRIHLVLEYKGKKVIDERIANLLKLIIERGSLYSATRSLGIPYSRAWDWITKTERELGIELITRKRGGIKGGGATVTEEGKKLLEFYFSKAKEYGLDISTGLITREYTLPDIIFAGSHDPILEVILSSYARSHNLDVEFAWIGSCAGLLVLMLNEADITGVHLLDLETGEYNIPFLKRYWLEEKVAVIRGYEREMCLAFRPDVMINSLEEAIERGYRLSNRNVGSGTRILLDYLIDQVARGRDLKPEELKRKIPGYGSEAKTHFDVAKSIATGQADYGLVLRFVAENYGLKCLHVTWEKYDFVIPINRLNKEAVRDFVNYLKSEEVRKIVSGVPGYRIPIDFGEIVYKPAL